MKTTIDIPDALMIRAKKRAVELRRPVRELVIEGLRARLEKPARTSRHQATTSIRWVIHEGGTPPAINLADRTEMHQLFANSR